MLEKIKKIRENKVLKTIYNIFYGILFVVTVIILLAVVLQRVSNNTLSLGGFKMFNILTESMVPKYQVGDVLLAKTIHPNEIKLQDDIVYRGEKGDFSGKIITHQVIKIEEENGEYKFHTKGIANAEKDPAPISASQIQGKIIYKIQTLSFVTKIINNLYAFYFVVFMPIVILIFLEIRRIALNKREPSETEEESKEKSEK